jgi:hypothetical protein
MQSNLVKISTTVPPADADKLRQALGEAGAGVFGDYTFCSFTVRGTGRFKASKNADPHVGEPGEFTVTEEEQIEVTCERVKAKQVVAAIRHAHPYEEPIIEIITLINEEEL